MYRCRCYGRRFDRRHVFTSALIVLFGASSRPNDLFAGIPCSLALRMERTLDVDTYDVLALENVGTATGDSVTARNASTYHHYSNSTHGQHGASGRKSGNHGQSHSVVGSALASLSQGTVAVHSSSSISTVTDSAHGVGFAFALFLIIGIGTIMVALCASGARSQLQTPPPFSNAWCPSRHTSEPEEEPDGAPSTESLERQFFPAFRAPVDEKAQHQQIFLPTDSTTGTFTEELSLQREFSEVFHAAEHDVTPVSGAALRRDAVDLAVEAAVASVEDSVRAANAAHKEESDIAMAPKRNALEAAAKRAAEDRPRISRGEDPFDSCSSAVPLGGQLNPPVGRAECTVKVCADTTDVSDARARRNRITSDAPSPEVDPFAACPSAAPVPWLSVTRAIDEAPAAGDALTTQKVSSDSDEKKTARFGDGPD